DLVLADNPLSYYQLDEISGAAASDSSGNNHHAAYVDNPIQGTPGATFDPDNRAVGFDGAFGHVELPAGFADFSSGLTLEVWVYPTDRTSSQTFVELSNGAAQDVIALGTNSNSDA